MKFKKHFNISDINPVPSSNNRPHSCPKYVDHAGKLPLTYNELAAMEVLDPTAHVDLLWEVSFIMRQTRPAWSGVMQSVHCGEHPGKSSVLFLPMIDMNASDISCIFSTLHFVCR